MKLNEISLNELQRMRLKYKSPKSMALYFEGDFEKNIKYIEDETVPPTTYCKRIGINYLKDTILAKGYTLAAKELGVSSSYLKSFFKDSPIVYEFTSEEAQSFSERCEYTTVFKKVTGRKLEDYRKDAVRPTSHLTSYKGEVSELFYQKIRGEDSVTNMNLKDPHCPYDFDDQLYGHVNVKSSKSYKTKSGDKYWKFSTGGKYDHLALVGWDSKYNQVQFVSMIIKGHPYLNKKSFNIYLSDLPNFIILHKETS